MWDFLYRIFEYSVEKGLVMPCICFILLVGLFNVFLPPSVIAEIFQINQLSFVGYTFLLVGTSGLTTIVSLYLFKIIKLKIRICRIKRVLRKLSKDEVALLTQIFYRDEDVCLKRSHPTVQSLCNKGLIVNNVYSLETNAYYINPIYYRYIGELLSNPVNF